MGVGGRRELGVRSWGLGKKGIGYCSRYLISTIEPTHALIPTQNCTITLTSPTSASPPHPPSSSHSELGTRNSELTSPTLFPLSTPLRGSKLQHFLLST
uniref:Uncharacterized protein n=1 Tax=Desertifilum tharense IPPAS B-1220 TaxID=1781255 RepID=A0ACD5GWZ8_9CYAN